MASAMVNTMQQIGGSIGIALLSAFAAQSTSGYLASHARPAPTAAVVQIATTHGYTVAFAISAAILATAGLLCGALMPRRLAPPVEPTAPAPSQPESRV